MSLLALLLPLLLLSFVSFISCGETFDFIVVGAGASGSIVATRLIQRTNYRVLLLEGGAKGSGQRDVGGDDYVASDFKKDPVTGKLRRDKPWTRYDVPTMADSIRLASDVLDNTWNITPVGFMFSQAKVVGGNMATNGMFWTPLLKSDMDGWNIPQYNAANFWPYVRKVENATLTGYGGSPNRGNSGPINVQMPSFMDRTQLKFQSVCNAAGYGNGSDFNAGTIPANKVYQGQMNIREGVRDSTSVAYLKSVLTNPRLTLRPGCTVTKVLFRKRAYKVPLATGVEYSDENGVLRQVSASREVIIAAGDLQTAKILYYSGIGPESILNAWGITPIVKNNMIGQKIRNHQRAGLTYTDTTLLNVNFYSTPALSVQYARDGSGVMGSRAFTSLAYNTANCASSSSHPCPDMLALAGAVAGATPSSVYAQNFALTITLARNTYANGTISLTSSNPLAGTIFTSNLFQVDDDLNALADGMIKMRQIMAAHWPTAVETAPGPSVDTPAKLKDWIKANGTTTCHYHGSAPMGTTSNYPTDINMKVRGVEGLRLVGPAVIPAPVYPGMQLLACALGEKGADLIIADC